MPMNKNELDELQKMLKRARQKELSFGLCLGKTPEDTILYLHIKKPGELLMRKAKKAGETSKTSYGLCNVTGRTVSLTCEGDFLSGMARNIKRFLLKNDIKMKVDILDRDGNLLDSDGEPEEDEDKPATVGDDDLDPAAQAWAQVDTKMTPLVRKFAETGNDKGPAVRKAWEGAQQAAAGGDYKFAMAVARKLKPLVTGGSVASAAPPSPKAKV